MIKKGIKYNIYKIILLSYVYKKIKGSWVNTSFYTRSYFNIKIYVRKIYNMIK